MIRSCTAMMVLAGAFALPAGAASPHHAAVPRPVLDGRCGVHRLQTAYVAGNGPTCCADSIGCAEFLSKTTFVQPKAPIRS